MLRVVTWNINSVRLRFGLVERLIHQCNPDVVCLQETKCPDAAFPSSGFKKLGYDHIALHGQKGYHGVATISKIPFLETDKRKFCNVDDARHIRVTLDAAASRQRITIHNFYVPAGGDVPDRDVNQKFGHKLDFLDELEEWIETDQIASLPTVLLGDLNIAPLETDVWNHKALLKVVSHSPIEVEKLGKLFAAGPWHDAMRTIVKPDEQLYTWWSYRSPQWEVADKGRRLDHVWLSGALNPALKDMNVIKEARGWPQPSDHVPVVVDLDLRKLSKG